MSKLWQQTFSGAHSQWPAVVRHAGWLALLMAAVALPRAVSRRATGIGKTVQRYLDNQARVTRVRSGACRERLTRQCGAQAAL